MVVRQAMVQAVVGAAVGILGSLLLSRLMSNMLYRVERNDPLTFGCAVLLLGLAALIATYIPARKPR